eukprot:633803-Pelagomonas_calceolata.AAC.5
MSTAFGRANVTWGWKEARVHGGKQAGLILIHVGARTHLRTHIHTHINTCKCLSTRLIRPHLLSIAPIIWAGQQIGSAWGVGFWVVGHARVLNNVAAIRPAQATSN